MTCMGGFGYLWAPISSSAVHAMRGDRIIRSIEWDTASMKKNTIMLTVLMLFFSLLAHGGTAECVLCSDVESAVINQLCADYPPRSMCELLETFTNFAQDQLDSVAEICPDEPGGGSVAACAEHIVGSIRNTIETLTGERLDCGTRDLLTREEAIEIVFDVIVPPSPDHDVTAFLGMDMLSAGDVIGPFAHEERSRAIAGATWFCWINDNPQAFFQHNTRYVFIDAETGDVEVIVEGWWPELNGDSIFMSDEAWESADTIIYSCIHTEDVAGEE